MGIDTDVLLRVRDRKALREALQAHADRERKRWADEGREAGYEELLSDGYDPIPLIRPLDDGSVSIFTGLRFHDDDMEFAIRCWLYEHLGDALRAIHDDPRGVFVSPDICEPRARTYEGLIDELATAGRFIDPSPPTPEEHAERERAFQDFSVGMDAVRSAHASGDSAAVEAALAAAPESVRKSWRAQNDFAARMQAFAPLTIDLGSIEEDGLVPPAMAKRLGELMGTASGEDGDDGPVTNAKLAAMFERFVSAEAAALEADPLGFGRVSMLLPPVVMTALAKERAEEVRRLDVQERVDLADGSALLVTSRLGENVMEAMALAELLEAAGVDREAIGPLPFFRESLIAELTDVRSFDEARSVLGGRAEILPLRTSEEHFANERAKAGAWLEGDG